TDPEEGSALGVAVVDHFRHVCGAHVLASTHFGGLKMYAANAPGVINASVEFDEKTLQPTYRLLVGLAGASAGLNIAQRFGIPQPIISSASGYVSASSRTASEYLLRLKRDSEEAAAQRLALEEERAAVAEKYAALNKEAAKREEQRQRGFAEVLQRSLAEFEKRSRELIARIEDRAERIKLEREAQKSVAELRREAQRAASAGRASDAAADAQVRGIRVVRDGKVLEPVPDGSANESAAEAGEIEYRSLPGRQAGAPIKIGDRVRLRQFGWVGIVDSIKEDEADIRVGSLRLREKLDQLEVVEAVPVKAKPDRAARLRASRGTEIKLATSGESSRAELNVIGQSTDQAIDVVDKFLDEGFLNGLSEVRIVHGHGTGALRRAIGELLRDHPHVANFRSATPEQGGAGATVVELRQ